LHFTQKIYFRDLRTEDKFSQQRSVLGPLNFGDESLEIILVGDHQNTKLPPKLELGKHGGPKIANI
jgi:hypothetical protein